MTEYEWEVLWAETKDGVKEHQADFKSRLDADYYVSESLPGGFYFIQKVDKTV